MTSASNTQNGYRAYLVGFALAVVLTAIPFGLVFAKALPFGMLFPLIVVLAVVQMLVHLRYFLHLGLRSSPWEVRLSGGLAAIMILIMALGTLWVMTDLDIRMMTMGM